ncbi:hypothetical protein ACTXT7_011846 [Hymenolepis weldensis]
MDTQPESKKKELKYRKKRRSSLSSNESGSEKYSTNVYTDFADKKRTLTEPLNRETINVPSWGFITIVTMFFLNLLAMVIHIWMNLM